MGSSANVNTANVELTPMRVKWNGVDLGGTSGGANVNIKHEFADITVDQFGTTVADSILSGQMYSVKVILAETKLKDNWKVAFPSMKLVTSGPNKMMYFDAQIGDSLLARAQNLILHPLSKTDADLSGDFKFFKATAKSAVEIEFGPENQTGLEVEFMIFPDTSVLPAKFFIHGDPTIGLVAATLAQASYVGTGNGVLSAITAGSAAATESITVTCVTPAVNGGTFHVNGSVSGPLGLAIVGTPFVNAKGNFTINDGSTDFIAGDVFTLTSTAANYV